MTHANENDVAEKSRSKRLTLTRHKIIRIKNKQEKNEQTNEKCDARKTKLGIYSRATARPPAHTHIGSNTFNRICCFTTNICLNILYGVLFICNTTLYNTYILCTLGAHKFQRLQINRIEIKLNELIANAKTNMV